MVRPVRPADTTAIVGDGELLRAMIESISGELELEPLLHRIIRCACELIGADAGAIGLVEKDGTRVRTTATHRMPGHESGSEMPIGCGLTGSVLAARAPIMSRYGDLPGAVAEDLAEHDVIGVPIMWDEDVLGVLGIGVHPPRRLGREQLELAQAFSRHAAIAIANSQRYLRERRRRVRFELVSRIAGMVNAGTGLMTRLQQVADAIHDMLGFPNVDIPLIDADDPEVLVVSVRGGHYKAAIQKEDRLSIHAGVMGAAVRERRVQRVDQIASDPRYLQPPVDAVAGSELAVPILFADTVLGVLNVEGTMPFDDLDQTTLEIIAEHLAAAIETDRLQARQREAAVLSERQRLAHELHDSVTQLLSSISLTAQSLEPVIRCDPQEAESRSARLVELTQMAFADMRSLLHELAPTRPRAMRASGGAVYGLDRDGLGSDGFEAALARIVPAMLPPHIVTRLDCTRYCPQPTAVEASLLRICIEALSNALRHSRADTIEIEARAGRRYLILRIRDNGQGLAARPRRGLGLNSMRQRARELGGRLRIGRALPRGTVVEARVPLHTAAEATAGS